MYSSSKYQFREYSNIRETSFKTPRKFAIDNNAKKVVQPRYQQHPTLNYFVCPDSESVTFCSIRFMVWILWTFKDLLSELLAASCRSIRKNRSGTSGAVFGLPLAIGLMSSDAALGFGRRGRRDFPPRPIFSIYQFIRLLVQTFIYQFMVIIVLQRMRGAAVVGGAA